MPQKRLIINADDLGFVDSVNRGIIEAIENGVVTSTSLLVNMPGCDDAIRRLRDLAARGGTVGVGLHFNIVVGRPLTAAKSLVNPRTGEFLPLLRLAWRLWAGHIDAEDVQRELDAQLERATSQISALGLRLTHIDSHRHAHALASVFHVMTTTARRHRIAHVRHPYEARSLIATPRAAFASRALRMVLSHRKSYDDVGFSGIGAMRSRTFEADILGLIAALPEGDTELMVHPGYNSPELAAIDSYTEPRERELRALTSPALRDRIRELGVELTRFGAPATARSE